MFSKSKIINSIKLSELVEFMPKSKFSAGSSLSNGKYPFYLSGKSLGTLNQYMLEGCYIIANDGGEVGFRLTSGKFSYSDHCICFKGKESYITKNLFEYLNLIKNEISHTGFVGSGLKNIGKTYLKTIKIPDLVYTENNSLIFDLVNYLFVCEENKIALLLKMKKYLLSNLFI